jgi:hypothetical protein
VARILHRVIDAICTAANSVQRSGAAQSGISSWAGPFGLPRCPIGRIQVNRLVIEVTDPFDTFRQRYEGAVPRLDRDKIAALVRGHVGWDEVLAVTEAAAPTVSCSTGART